MTWWRQELLVVMIACFILYPAWAQATLQVFACYVLDDGSEPYPDHQLAQWKRGYWILNMNQECYSGKSDTAGRHCLRCCAWMHSATAVG